MRVTSRGIAFLVAMQSSPVRSPSPTCLVPSCLRSSLSCRRALRKTSSFSDDAYRAARAPPRTSALLAAPSQSSTASSRTEAADVLIRRGPDTPKPSYAAIDAEPQNRLFMHLFRQKLAEGVGQDAPEPGFEGIITLTRLLNKRHSPADVQRITRAILLSLFPAWLLPAFKVMFARPLPTFSKRLNAAVTAWSCQWLMGPCAVNDVELPDGSRLRGHGVKVERCRVLEESGCASVCINSCKVPTQAFFVEDMGLPLRMTPDYNDFSCQFSFGLPPLGEHEDDAFQTPCFGQCPTRRRASSAAQCHNVQAETK